MTPRSCRGTSAVIFLLANLRGAGKCSPESISVDSATFCPGIPRRAFVSQPPFLVLPQGQEGWRSHHVGQLAPRTDGWTHTPPGLGQLEVIQGAVSWLAVCPKAPQGPAVPAHPCAPSPSRLMAARPRSPLPNLWNIQASPVPGEAQPGSGERLDWTAQHQDAFTWGRASSQLLGNPVTSYPHGAHV